MVEDRVVSAAERFGEEELLVAVVPFSEGEEGAVACVTNFGVWNDAEVLVLRMGWDCDAVKALLT